MTNHLHLRTASRLLCLLSAGLFALIAGLQTGYGQVSFTQTTNADFYKGNYNDLIVASNIVSLPFQATDVQTWLTTTVLPQILQGHKAAVWNNRYVYVVGGYNDVTYSNTVYRATLQSGGISSFTTLNPLPVGLRDHAVVIGTNTIYVLGGRDDSNIYNAIYYATINADGSLGDWQTSAVNLPATLWGHTAVYANGYIYVAGGANTMTSTAALLNMYYAKVYTDNTLSAFTATTGLPQARNGHSMVAEGNKVFVIGGFTTGGAKRNTVYFAGSNANGTIGSWAAATALPVTISNHSSVIMNGLITVMAGETGGTLSNSVYYADVNASPMAWTLSPNVMYDRTKDGAAFATNGWIGYCGGENLSGTPIHNTRYANLSASTARKKTGQFVSNPFYELGAERVITELTFAATTPAGTSVSISYRTAGNDGNWSNWSAPTTTSPIPIGQTKRYLQYKVGFASDGVSTAQFNELTLVTPGTQLAGNLNSYTSFTLAQSPYWVTSDISFTAGTHVFDAGVELNFLPQTGLTVSQANVVCNGTAANPVRFKGYTNESGLWKGIYFDPNSDNGVSSQFYYTEISGAGYGTWSANLYCNGTNEPLLANCNIHSSGAHGLRLNGSHITIENTSFNQNAESGIYLENSNPSFINSTSTANSNAGIYFTSTASVPNFANMALTNNLYGIRFPSPDFTFTPPNGTLTLTGNTYNGICIDGGRVSENRTWNTVNFDYIMLGDLVIGKANTTARLTIEPGNTVKFIDETTLQVGTYIPWSNYGGELYAIGTLDSLITFTSFNGATGGWSGIYFDQRSNQFGGASVMDWCVVENGNDYNIYCYETGDNQFLNCTIRNAAVDGMKLYNSPGLIQECTFSGSGRYPIYYEDWRVTTTLTNNTYTSKGINLIGHAGGHFTENRTLQNDGIDYHILNTITIGQYSTTRRLTIEPGLTLHFEPGTALQVGTYIPYSQYGGELYAEGTAGQPITFKPYNNLPGGWEGLFFHDNSDNYSATSSLQYCIVEKGNEYNIFCDKTTQPSISNCTIRNAVQYGIKMFQSSPQIHDSQLLNNGSYPVYYTDWSCNSDLSGNTYSGNTPNVFALSGGHYTDSRTLYNDNVDYLVLSNIIIAKANNSCRLTLEPGTTLLFNEGTMLQIGTYIPYSHYGGELYAEGTSGNPISFKPYNNTAGGWEGLYFHDYSDSYSSTSVLTYCVIEKGNSYNMMCHNTNQPGVIEHCDFIEAIGNGLNLNNASIGNLKNSNFTGNGENGILLDGTSQPVIGNDAAFSCNIFDNGVYNVYNNTTININARYNYWGTPDSAAIAATIYDKYDNVSKGIVIFGNFAEVPAIPETHTNLSGDVWYANAGKNPIKNAPMQVLTFGGAPVASATTNTAGHYAFAPFTSGSYTLNIAPVNPFGGVNATDALLVLNHFAKIDTLKGIHLSAADVNASSTVNGTDALFILKRWANMIPAFPAGDWVYNSASLTVNGNQVVNDFEMLFFGDVNSSYTPADKESGNVMLEYEGSQMISSFSEFTVKVIMKDAAEAGAISFGLFFPEEYIDVLEVVLTGAESEAIVHISDGLARIGWAGLNTLTLPAGEVVFTLNCVAKDLSSLTSPIQLGLFASSEFADGMALPFQGITVAVPELITLTTSVKENGYGNFLRAGNHPNPCSDATTISYSIPADGFVTITVMNLLGETVAIPVSESHTAGAHNLEFNTGNLEAGIYLYVLEFNNPDYSGRIVNKLSVTR